MKIQMDSAEQIRQNWAGKPCNHPSFSKEYFFSMSTGDYVCNQCGESFSSEEIRLIGENNKK